MPATRVVFYREGEWVPMREWLAGLQPKAQDKCVGRLLMLRALGHELRRPAADYIGANIYELRASCRGINYRMLFFFHGPEAVVGSHGFVKQQAAVPFAELRRAAERKARFETAPGSHSFPWEG